MWALEAPADIVRLVGTFSAWYPTADPWILLLALVCLCLLDLPFLPFGIPGLTVELPLFEIVFKPEVRLVS